MTAPTNMSPMEMLRTLPKSTSTMEGGMIWPRVPAAQMVPVASSGEYPLLSMVGRLRSPMVTTVAPTMPVEAASTAPTMMTDMASPPRIRPNSRAMVSRSSSASPDFSNISPI